MLTSVHLTLHVQSPAGEQSRKDSGRKPSVMLQPTPVTICAPPQQWSVDCADPKSRQAPAVPVMQPEVSQLSPVSPEMGSCLVLLEGQRAQKPWRIVEGWHCQKGGSQRSLSAPSQEEKTWPWCRNLMWLPDVRELHEHPEQAEKLGLGTADVTFLIQRGLMSWRNLCLRAGFGMAHQQEQGKSITFLP